MELAGLEPAPGGRRSALAASVPTLPGVARQALTVFGGRPAHQVLLLWPFMRRLVGPRSLLIWSGVLATIVFSYLALRGVDFSTATEALRESNPAWLVAAVPVLALAVFLRVLRWRYLFPPGTRPPVRAVPSAPAAVGVFEAATLIALTSYGANRSVALSYAIVLHLVNFVPYLVLGPLALRRTPWRRRGESARYAIARCVQLRGAT